LCTWIALVPSNDRFVVTWLKQKEEEEKMLKQQEIERQKQKDEQESRLREAAELRAVMELEL